MKELLAGEDKGIISAKFHNTVGDMIVNRVRRISIDSGIRTVVLSGGTFQNRFLSSYVEACLKEVPFRVLLPRQMPPNDGGIALGQLVIAAKKREIGNY